MGSLEEFKEQKEKKKTVSAYYGNLRDKSLEENKFGEAGYTGEEFENLLSRRNDESMFATQQSYYFRDRDLLSAKTARYRKLATDENGDVARFAATHKNRSAKKRKKKAAAAADAFEQALELEKKVSFKDLSAADKFKHESKIMKLHLQGRIEAAKAKATSKENEAYRIAKAKYSCTSALKNQLDTLLKEDPQNAELIAAQTRLSEELTKTRKDFYKKTPSAKKRWIDDQGFEKKSVINNELVKLKKINANYNAEDARIKLKYEYFGDNQSDKINEVYKDGIGPYNATSGDKDRIFRSMCLMTYLDKNRKPLTKEDAQKEEFNKKWINLCAENSKAELEKAKNEQATSDVIRDFEDEVAVNDYEREKIILERYAIFEKIPLPTPEEFKKKGAVKIFEENPALIYDCNHLSLTTDNLRKKEPFLQKYLDAHPKIMLRLDAWSQFATILLKQLSDEHLIKQEKGRINADTEKEVVDIEDYIGTYIGFYDALQSKQNEEDQAEKEYNEKLAEGKKAEKPAHMVKREQEKAERDKRDEYFRLMAARKEFVEKNAVQSIEDLKKINPNFNKDSYDIYIKLRPHKLMCSDPELIESTVRAQEIYGNGKDFTITRAYAPVLRNTQYNDRFEPADKQAQEDHEWNKKWVKAVEDKNLKIQDEMILQSIPKIYENSGIVPPDPSNIDAFVDDLLKNHIKEYIEVSSRNLGLSNLKLVNETAKKYIDEHPVYDATIDVFTVLCSYIRYYCQWKYRIDPQNGGNGINVVNEKTANQMRSLLSITSMQYKEAYDKYRGLDSKGAGA